MQLAAAVHQLRLVLGVLVGSAKPEWDNIAPWIVPRPVPPVALPLLEMTMDQAVVSIHCLVLPRKVDSLE
jgi:hypothetical protein